MPPHAAPNTCAGRHRTRTPSARMAERAPSRTPIPSGTARVLSQVLSRVLWCTLLCTLSRVLWCTLLCTLSRVLSRVHFRAFSPVLSCVLSRVLSRALTRPLVCSTNSHTAHSYMIGVRPGVGLAKGGEPGTRGSVAGGGHGGGAGRHAWLGQHMQPPPTARPARG